MPNNNFIYTNHAIKKIGFYGLEKWQIEKVLLEPDKVQAANVTNLKNVIKVSNHVEIGVTIKEDNGLIKIISVWKRNLFA
jgi:UDP-glucose 4-epimerase